jgi:hypothetical protein
MWHAAQRCRFERRLKIAATILALTVGCGAPPVAPTPPLVPVSSDPPSPPTAPVSSTSAAALSIEDAFAIGGTDWTCSRDGCQPGPGYLYGVRFLLREVAGNSGATIKTIVVRNPSQRIGGTSSQETGEACWVDLVRVPPGGTLDRFHNDAGSAWLSYCYVGIDGAPGIPSLDLEVHFVDDMQGRGSVSTTITRFR